MITTYEKRINACNLLQAYIIESEMAGHIDKTDSWYPLYVNLRELRSKLFDELDLTKSISAPR